MSNTIDKIELRSEEVQEILTYVPTWMIRWGSSLFVCLIFLVLMIAWFIKYPDTIESEALITTRIPPQKEFAMVTAKIDTIYVKESQIVARNSILAVLDNAASTSDVYFLKSIIDTIEFKNDVIDFPIDSLPILFLGDIDQSFAIFENSYFQYKLNQQLQPFKNEAIANRISLSELKGRLAILSAQQSLKESEFAFIQADLDRNTTLYSKGVISKKELEDKQLEVLSAKRDLKNMNVSISQLRESIGGARKARKGTEINSTREEKLLLKTVIQSLNQLKKVIRDWEDKFVLKSEIEGRVSFLNYWNKNQTVAQGDLVFTIIPSTNSQYMAKIKAPSLNSGKIRIGQSVNIRLQNYPETEFGILKGQVESISVVPDEEGFYLVDVSLPETLITSYKKKIKFKQDMRGTSEIITEELRLLERFFYQFKTLFKN